MTVLSLDDCGTVLDVFCSGDENIYLLSEYDNNYKITTINENFDTKETSINLDVNNSTYAYANNKFYFFSKDTYIGDSMRYTIIDSYDCITGIKRKRVINYLDPQFNGTFAVDSEENYFIINENNIEVYTSDYQYLKTIPIEEGIINLTNSADGQFVFCTSYKGLTVINGDKSYLFNIDADKIFSAANGYFTTNKGELYLFDGGEIYDIYSGFDNSYGSAVIDDMIFGIKNGSLITISNGNEITLDEVGEDAFVASLKNTCCCIIQNGGGADVKFYSMEDVKNAENTTTDSTNSNYRDSNSQTDYTSAVYNFNTSSGIISGISPGSTVATVRGNIQGDSLIFYDKNGKVKTSGSVGTGMSVEFAATHQRFYIVVYGELSGEGNINSNDKKLLVNHILEKNKLNGFYAEAADINGDSAIDLKDLVALDGYIKGDYTINQKR